MKAPKPSHTITKVLLMSMAISTLIAVPINGGEKGWWAVWGLEYDAISHIFHFYSATVNNDFGDYCGILLLLIHFAVFALPFVTRSRYFDRFLIWVPLSYLIVTTITLFLFLIFLIPFTILWGITVRVWRRNNRQTLA
ncbi:MAG TPA: hypothetical protein VIQ77_10970 [Mucilaginibacter sp.]